jgi:hypothetical protein
VEPGSALHLKEYLKEDQAGSAETQSIAEVDLIAAKVIYKKTVARRRRTSAR